MKKIGLLILVVLIAGAVVNNAQKENQTKKGANTLPKDTVAQTSPQTGGKNDKEIVIINTKYGTHPRNTINVFIPKGASMETPFILFLHGGAWTMGDKNDVAIVQAALGKEGIASAAINYRYASNTVHYPELMADVGTAVQYIVDHKDEWNVDTTTITLGGISAGAHMSMLYAYGYDTGNHIKAVVSMAGPTDLTDTAQLELADERKLLTSLESMVGATYTRGKSLDANFTETSPLKRIKNVPTLMIHGTSDRIVLYSQATKLNDALQSRGIPHKLVTIPGADHDVGLSKPANATIITKEITTWIKTYDR